jgi:hypothetical protein
LRSSVVLGFSLAVARRWDLFRALLWLCDYKKTFRFGRVQ